MTYRFNKQQKIDNKLNSSKEKKDQVNNEEFTNFEEFITKEDMEKLDDPFYQVPEAFRIKEIQYFMNKHNKSKVFIMFNAENSIRDKQLKASYECPLAFDLFFHLSLIKDKQNICEVSQREMAKALNVALSEIEVAMKYLYENEFVCILDKRDMPNIKFQRPELKKCYFLNMNLVWNASQSYKKDIIELIPENFRCYTKFDKFITVDAHVSMKNLLTDLIKEDRHAFCLLFVMAFFMNTKNRYFASVKCLSKKIKKSLKYVLGLLTVLIEKGFIKEGENCFIINSTVTWNRNQTFTFENDIASLVPQRLKRAHRSLMERLFVSSMYLRAKKEMYLNNTLHKLFI